VTPAALNRALRLQQTAGGRLGTILMEQAFITEETLARALAKISGREYARWEAVKVTAKEIVDLLPAKVAVRAAAIPFERQGRVLKVAMREPNDLAAEDELAFVTGRKIEPFIIAEFRLLEGLERFYNHPRQQRYRMLSERVDRGALRVAPPPDSPPPVPPPPPPSVFGAPPEPAASTQEAPPIRRNSGVWRAPSLDEGHIDIATWRPGMPRPSRTTPLVPLPAKIQALDFEPGPDEPATPESAAPAEAAGPAPSPSAIASKPEAERKPATSAPISLEMASLRMKEAETRDEIADAAADYLASRYPLVALFKTRKDDVISWQIRGAGVSPKDFMSIKIPFSQPSLFLNVKLSLAPYQGAIPTLPAHEALLAAIGHAPAWCVLVPVLLKKRVVAFLLVESPGTVLPPEKLEALKGIAGGLSDGFGRLILEQRGRNEPA
jgi:hypothetical protein